MRRILLVTVLILVGGRGGHANVVLQENLLAGTEAWTLAKPDLTKIEGFASAVSVAVGQQVRFYVNTPSPAFTLDIYRLGWYQGMGGRFYLSSGVLPRVSQPGCLFELASRMTSCSNWQPSFTITIPPTWISGIYWVKFTETSQGFQSATYFVVRNDNSPAAFLVQIPVTTHQAYNNWGGKSLYSFNSTDDNRDGIGDRAFKVSYDRPFVNPFTPLFVSEGQTIRWMEKEGYDITYTTSVDTHARPELLLRHKAWLSVGHDEYWSREMRDHVEAARDRGVHLAFFAANAIYWQIRFEASPLGEHRVQVCYREILLDPYYTGMNNTARDFSRVTVRFRDFPVNRPENGLIGIMYSDLFSAGSPPLDWFPSNLGHWVFAGTGMQDGDKIPTIVGYEFDRVFDNGLTPPGLVVLSRSPVCDTEGRCSPSSNSAIYQAGSGAWVFATGTIWWAWGLDRFAAWCGSSCPSLPDSRLQRITANILGRFQGFQAALGVSATALEYAASPGLVPAAQTFQIGNTGSGALGWTASVSGGSWATVSPSSGVAPSTVTVTVNPAGLPTGIHRATIQMDALLSSNATNSPKRIEVVFRVATPTIHAGGVLNGASFATPASLSPGSLVSVFGTNLAPGTATATQLPLPTSLNGAEVLVNGAPVPLLYVSPAQINFQMPFEVSGSTASIAVRASGLTSATATVPLANEAPGIFRATSVSPTAGTVLNEDGTLNISLNPARAGSILQIFATGLGRVSPAVITGQTGATAEPLNRVLTPTNVLIDGAPAEVIFAGLAPGFVGLYQVNVRLPASVPTGNVTVVIQAGSRNSNTVTVAVQQ